MRTATIVDRQSEGSHLVCALLADSIEFRVDLRLQFTADDEGVREQFAARRSNEILQRCFGLQQFVDVRLVEAVRQHAGQIDVLVAHETLLDVHFQLWQEFDQIETAGEQEENLWTIFQDELRLPFGIGDAEIANQGVFDVAVLGEERVDVLGLRVGVHFRVEDRVLLGRAEQIAADSVLADQTEEQICKEERCVS